MSYCIWLLLICIIIIIIIIIIIFKTISTVLWWMNYIYFSFFKRTTLYTHFNGEQYRTSRWKSTLKGRRSTTCTLLWPTVGIYFSATCIFLTCHSFENEPCHDLFLIPINSNSSQTFSGYSRSEVIICVFLRALTPQTVPNSRDLLSRSVSQFCIFACFFVCLAPTFSCFGRQKQSVLPSCISCACIWLFVVICSSHSHV